MERSVTWDLASPGISARFPDNPAAGAARFKAEGLRFPDDTPLDVWLVREGEQQDVLLLRLRCAWRQEAQNP